MKKITLFLASCLLIFVFMGVLTACNGETSPVVSEKSVPTYTGMTLLSSLSPESDKTMIPSNAFRQNDYNEYEQYDWYQRYAELWYPRPGIPWHDGESETNIQTETDTDSIETPIEDIVEIELMDNGIEKYYVRSGEKFIIQVHIKNPSQFEIQSVSLNGTKYANYMFKDGSTMTLVLLEMTAPNEPGYTAYTIDAIKYIDETEIKSGRLSGEKTIDVGVAYSQEPTCSIRTVKLDTTSVSFDVNIHDSEAVLDDRSTLFVVSDGEQAIYKKPIQRGQNSIEVTELLMGTPYQYGVVASYDMIDGKGTIGKWLAQDQFNTQKAYQIDNVQVYKTQMSFTLTQNADESTIKTIDLLDDDKIVATAVDIENPFFTDLLSNHNYKLKVTFEYIFNAKRQEDNLVLCFKTGEKKEPVITINEVDSTQTSISANIAITNEDMVEYALGNYEIYDENSFLQEKDMANTVTFENLTFGKTYRISVNCMFDLNDGNGIVMKQYSQYITTKLPPSSLSLNGIIYKIEEKNGIYSAIASCQNTSIAEINILSHLYGSLPVVAISQNGFKNCSLATSATIPETIKIVGENAFLNCTALQYTEYKDGYYLGNAGNPHKIFVKAKTKDITEIIIHDNTEIACYSALAGCSMLETISLPFAGSNKTIPTGHIYQRAFGYLFGKTPYSGGDPTEQDYYNAQSNTWEKATYYIPSSLISVSLTGDTILPNSFNNCIHLSRLTLTEKITNLEQDAFSGCTGLEGIYYSGDITAWCNISFGGETTVGTFLALATTTIGGNPLQYAHYLYINNTLVTDLVVPNSVLRIGQAFVGGTFSSVTISEGVQEIGDAAFFNGSFERISIPDSVTNIGYSAFENSNLPEIIIPNAVSEIKANTFFGCTQLTKITIPKSVVKIGPFAFGGTFINYIGACTNLAGVYYTGDIASWCNISFFTASAGMENISGVTTNPLSYAHNLYIDNILVTDLIIPNSVTKISAGAFTGATCLTSVTIPNSVIQIGSGAFFRCFNLTRVNYLGEHSSWCEIEFENFPNNNTFSSNPLTTAHALFINNELLTDIAIPATITELKACVFSGSTLKSITLENTIIKIGKGALANCSDLTIITYKGTVDQWNEIEKDEDWDIGTTYTIYCTDGTLDKE